MQQYHNRRAVLLRFSGWQVMQSSNVYSKLGERLGLSDHQAVLTLMLQKIATNLKVYGSSEQLVHLTLSLFQVRDGAGVCAGDVRAVSLCSVQLCWCACAYVRVRVSSQLLVHPTPIV